MKAVIFDIQRFCLHDGEGIRTTVFFKGCPLRCLWCHNPESRIAARQMMFYRNKCINCGRCAAVCEARSMREGVLYIDREKCTCCGRCIDACPTAANRLAGREAETDEIMETVLADKLFYGENGGMTLSGGEPSLQSEAALALIRKAGEAGIGTVVETCGFGKRGFFTEAAALGATFYFDMKAIDPEKHKKLCGVDNAVILANAEALFALGAKVVLRLPMIPGLNDSDADLALLQSFLRAHKGQYDHGEIMKYHNLGMAKAEALGTAYHAPRQNAGDEDAVRWLSFLESENVIISQ